ncbi:unnamed protein product [Penicillium salamii]|uniref:NACHT domain-containing protein n=1 Tax=Penicillium salamii TaxID=1612424 RepID=A0A9W4JLQ1_9EURO|nr:unnamed protein product [Penicillium salamii]CAG8061789.1 unnamed protein product [Penicillium salamii]CAG8140485.1 unnamed protein product [Penicillium salamii]CAG8149940.1 unnamed protein product [Penicillium salamii]CAG8158056.1 unnamed protein product [Penicillium salamii]
MTANIQQNGTNDGTQIGVNEGTVIIAGSPVDPLDQACLQDLRITDPRDDKERIKSTSDGLLEASYQWIRDNEAFKRWQDDKSNSKPVLWIRGNPGKGKTMLLCGIIEDLAKSHKNATISFFFCQATDLRINSAKSVLRGLIYLLVEQHRSLLRHVRARYDSARERLFKDVNAWHALVSIFTQILEDSALKSVYLGIDALDECGDGRDLLLDLIIETAKANSKIKWVVSSRNEREITELFDHAAQVALISLEMSEAFVSEAINAFIEHKVADLAQKKRYKLEVRRKVHRHLVLNTRGTFLWVSLVLKNLARTQSRHVNEKLKTFPPGLDALYHRMMDQVRKSDDADFCKQILGTILTVYRPVTLSELGSLLAGRMDGLDDIDTISDVIESCGSFLTVREDTVTLVHQSAKDFLDKEVQTEVLPKGVESEHHAIFSQCLSTLVNTLRRDMFGLRLPGTAKAQIRAPSPNPLASAEYACVYWVDHLDDCQSNEAYRLSLKNREMVDDFLRRKYLNWLEALSLLGKISDGIGAMRKLQTIFEVSFEVHLYM